MRTEIIRIFNLIVPVLILASASASPGAEVFIELSFEERPFSNLTSDYDAAAKDEDGNPYFSANGEESVHPGNMAILGISSLNNYAATTDALFISDAEIVAENLLKNSVTVNGARLFPYDFSFPLHGGPDVMTPPWYSCYAQGPALVFFSRLHEMTGDEAHLRTATEIYNSFGLKKGESEIWIAVEENGEIWFEEYPPDTPSHVLNGMEAGMFGIYEYYLDTRDENAAKLLARAVFTIKNHAYDYRRPGKLSYYCLGHLEAVGEEYHITHINYFKLLYAITGDAFFEAAAKDFQKDLDAYLKKTYGSGSDCFIRSLLSPAGS